MKKLQFITAIVFTVICSGFIFTSCNKPSCGGMVCENGGTCTGGTCSCPTGYSGNLCQTKANTAIQYQNNTFTPVTIGVNGLTQIIPVGGNATFIGQVGTVASGSANTAGAVSSLGNDNSGGTLGLTINWSIENTFPNSDTLKVPLDVGATYFFLKMVNSGSTNIIDFYVNVEFSYGQFYQDVTVPNGGVTYDLGYYLAYPSSNVQVQTSASKVIWQAVTLPFTNNQTYTASF
jgi:hypothetical protein